jgi:hypothetical protein
VWKQGWGEWLPAMQVAELATAFPRVTPGSRRVARAAPSSATPPAVPVAHYPRLRLLAKDVLSESPLPPAVAAPDHAPTHAERRTLRDRDQLQQDLVTSQVPAAVMLEAARAMQQLGGAPTRSSAERWSRLELGNFGEPPPAALAAPSNRRSTPARHTLAPHAMTLPAPAALEPYPSQPAQGHGHWLLVGVLLGSVIALLNISWPEAAHVPTLAGVARPPEAPAPAPRASETAFRALLPVEQTACIAPVDPEPTASLVDRTLDAEPAIVRVSDLPTQHLRSSAAARLHGPRH